jgi:hypothetical protein
MAGLTGLQVAEMRNLIAVCRREATNIRQTVAQVNTLVGTTWWKGTDADKFRNTWSTSDRVRILNVATELETVANQLSTQVQNQIITSSK